MLINLPESIDKVFICGDIHGNLEYIKYKVNSFNLKNAVIFLCGDIGLGFSLNWESKMLEFLRKKFKEKNIFVIAVRGNHDNPDLFQDEELTSNWLNVKDYTVVNVKGQNFLCVGGGISVDRTIRVPYKSYWPNEQIKYQPKVNQRIDVIISHTAPSFCYPISKGDFVLSWAKQDENLLANIEEERQMMCKVFDDYKETLRYWYYGHFHDSKYEIIKEINFRLLNIEEFIEHGRYSNDIC